MIIEFLSLRQPHTLLGSCRVAFDDVLDTAVFTVRAALYVRDARYNDVIMASSSTVLSTKRAGFVGLGRLGLCTALKFEQAGWDILGSDVFPAYVESINSKTLRSNEPGVEEALRSSSKLRATLSLEEVVEHADLLFILVATPTSAGEDAYDTSTLGKVLSDIARLRPKNKHIVVCCTVMPGYIANIGSFLMESMLSVDIGVSQDVFTATCCPVAVLTT